MTKSWTWKDKVEGLWDDPMGGLRVALADDFTTIQRRKAIQYLKEKLDEYGKSETEA